MKSKTETIILNKFQFTAQDYLAYLQMSNYGHVLVENDISKRSIEALLREPDADLSLDVNVDDVEHLIYFEQLYSNEEKIEFIFSNVIRTTYAHKLVRVIMEPFGGNRSPVLVPINDTLSITQRAEDVLNKILFRNIKTDHLGDVRTYLLQHVDLIDILPLVSRIASEAFSPETELLLELYRDPEVEDVYLALLGRNQQYDEQFLETIKMIRAGYTDLLTGKSGWILVTTDFETPSPR